MGYVADDEVYIFPLIQFEVVKDDRRGLRALGKGIDLNGITDPSHPCYSEGGEVRAMYENEPDVKKVIDTAKGVEGLEPVSLLEKVHSWPKV
ncbi:MULTISPECIES: hypothetical protein [unclassified Streptomyces]|uniref:hypothetical protein n=1 Tax=unclassified Streptomyces TaxID=2593676 RepID=UPI00381312A2